MATACITQVTLGFEPKSKPVVAAFDMRAPDVGRVHPLSRIAAPRGRDELCRRPSHDAARTTAQARGLGRAIGAPGRAAHAADFSVALDVAAIRPRCRRDVVTLIGHFGHRGSTAVVSLPTACAYRCERPSLPRVGYLSIARSQIVTRRLEMRRRDPLRTPDVVIVHVHE